LAEEICPDGPGLVTPKEKLAHVFEVWAVRAHEWRQEAPYALEILDCRLEFARDLVRDLQRAMERQVVAILDPIGGPSAELFLSRDVAKFLLSAVRGFQATANSAGELRQLIDTLLAITLSALEVRHSDPR
jgi:hypothetical protein